jgi:hypothetical protein
MEKGVKELTVNQEEKAITIVYNSQKTIEKRL